MINLNLTTDQEHEINAIYKRIAVNELDSTDYRAFKIGYLAALDEIERKNVLKARRKTKELIATDYIDKVMLNDANHYFFQGVYHDSTEHKQVVTNGQFMLIKECPDIPDNYSNQIVDIHGNIIEGNFPQWTRVIPSQENYELLEVTEEDIALICKSFGGAKCTSKRKDIHVNIALNIKCSLYMLDKINMFMSSVPKTKIYYNPKEHNKALVIKDIDNDKDLLLIMPLYNTNKYYVYDKTDRVVKELENK